MIELSRKELYRGWLIIPTDDYYVRLLSQNKKELSKYYKVTVDEWSIIDIFFNKRNSYPLVKEAGVPIPSTYYPNKPQDIPEIGEMIGYPCIIKPALMLNFYRYFKKKVFVCNDLSELDENIRRATKVLKINELMIQEIIPGSSENQYSVGMFYDRDKSYNYLVGRRKRQHPIDFGNATTFAETVDIPLLIEYAERILTKANYWGICEVEFKFDDRDGLYKFLEVNPRTWKWHYISEGAKIPFLMSLYNYMVDGRPIESNNGHESSWRDIVTDLPVILKMISQNKYKRSKYNNIENAVADITDVKPFFYQLFYLPYLFFER